MKTLTSSIFLLCWLFCLSAFGQLNSTYNRYRSGDTLIKQQVGYQDPGEPGVNRTWDFSRLDTLNTAYSLVYTIPPLQGDSLYIMGDVSFNKKQIADDELIIGTEHNTMYYYRLKNDTLYLLGHENPAVRLMYTTPIVQAVYPLNYGKQTKAGYISEGLYSGTVDLHTEGTVSVQADAFGKLILPDGDTISPALRVKTHKLILDKTPNYISDSTGVRLDQSPDYGKLVESYQWYTKGYRYPIFETIRNIDLKDSTEIFATAFYYPPQEHLYLDTDPENQALLDSLWTVDENKSKSAVKEIPFDLTEEQDYKVYPNPVVNELYVAYTLNNTSDVRIELFSMDGRLMQRFEKPDQMEGGHREPVDCSDIPAGSYILKLTRENESVTQIIIKK